MSDGLPDPLVPAEVDLTDFQFIPLYIARLQKSKAWLVCKRRPELAFYMMNLWMHAWHGHPAGSIEVDEDVLADAAMCPPRLWPKLRDDLLRGWLECSDGRMYHKVVAELALAAWAEKLAHRTRTKAATEARARRREEEDEARKRQRNDQRQTADVQRNEQRDVERNVHQGRGKGKGEGEVREREGTGNSSSAGAPPPRAAAIAVLVRNLEKDRGKASKITSIDPRVQVWADQGVTDDQLREAHALAVADREANGESAAINAGFLDVFVAKVRTPGNGTSRLNGSTGNTDWWSTNDGIIAKALEHGIETEGRDATWLRCAIAVKTGGDRWPWIDPRNGTQERLIKGIRRENA